MITVTFYKDEKLALGVKTDKGIFDVEAAANGQAPTTVAELIAQGEAGKRALQDLVETNQGTDALFLEEDGLTFGPSVPAPQKIICVGLNYKRHADECNMPYPKEPIIFSKFANTLTAHNADVKLPTKGKEFDYEAELVIVIGKEAKNVAKEDALSYVYGYTNGNDLSVRDLQFVSSQWLLGKTTDDFCPIGPYLVSDEHIDNPDHLSITLKRNGELRQNSNTSDLIFSCSEIISYISEHMTLVPGDIILTGTPEGVIMGDPEGQRDWLKPGDELQVEIENLGTLTTYIK
ncbi:fumarylacetoacetate hydrolase family protein [Halalkalibacter oceani]|uniref:Fumarylacetoacetate hydrolase family protein n=1 Tax=Halalkalibacter oceani TaxID=1653776 RepID=A0A9X2DRH4_9BACI|nr:fumarylacetoacetate hydrolase family protein [Halalkalibacter oceani]MCM3714810.1 fumarylacetoacetate hydrolase family protein [Halalkalibacter oceani]